MTETSSKVYDIVYPSPITLKEISSIVTVVKLWRHEIITYLESCTLWNELFLLTRQIPLERVIPGMPSAIYDSLREYVDTFRNSLYEWLSYHSHHVYLEIEEEYFDYILNNFHDFVWDWNGTIDYVRTAKLMLQCDRFSADEKYRIACLYCFEDEIKRYWPYFFDASINCTSTYYFNKFPQLCYWTCNLEGTPHNQYILTEEEMLVRGGSHHNSSSLEYFWRRISSKNHLKIAIQMLVNSTNRESFARSILPQLSRRRLKKFANNKGDALISRLMLDDLKPDCAVATWMYISNTIKGCPFHRLVKDLLLAKKNNVVLVNGRSISFASLCCEIWNTAPQHLKQWVFDNLLFEDSLFPMVRKYLSQWDLKDMTFLIAILHDASFEQRNAFWHNNWRNLLCGPRVEDLIGIMKMCFRDDYEMILFKETTMAIDLYENIEEYCDWLLEDSCFETFHDFVSFCCPDTLNKKELKMRLVRSSYLRENNPAPYIFWQDHKSTNEFIESVLETVDLRVEFKNQVISSPRILDTLDACIRLGEFTLVIEFLNVFTSEEGVIVEPLKQRLLDYFKRSIPCFTINRYQNNSDDNVLWRLLGGEDHY